MKLLCQLFGHKSTGYANQPPYLRIRGGAVDGIRIQHCRLEAKCDRCDETYTIGLLHMPADFNASLKRTKS